MYSSGFLALPSDHSFDVFFNFWVILEIIDFLLVCVTSKVRLIFGIVYLFLTHSLEVESPTGSFGNLTDSDRRSEVRGSPPAMS